jgi:carbon-monoxide dehydrogenase medium subunit
MVTSSVTPNGDLHGSAEYRKHLLGELARRAMRTALAVKG